MFCRNFRTFVNSADPDQTPRSAASDLGLHCFPMSRLWDTRNKWFKCNTQWLSDPDPITLMLIWTFAVEAYHLSLFSQQFGSYYNITMKARKGPHAYVKREDPKQPAKSSSVITFINKSVIYGTIFS